MSMTDESEQTENKKGQTTQKALLWAIFEITSQLHSQGPDRRRFLNMGIS